MHKPVLDGTIISTLFTKETFCRIPERADEFDMLMFTFNRVELGTKLKLSRHVMVSHFAHILSDGISADGLFHDVISWDMTIIFIGEWGVAQLSDALIYFNLPAWGRGVILK